MSHVDALSRNPSHVTHYEPVEVDFLYVNVSEAEWVLAAQSNDKRCKELHQILSRVPADEDDRRIHKEYVLKSKNSARFTMDGT